MPPRQHRGEEGDGEAQRKGLGPAARRQEQRRKFAGCHCGMTNICGNLSLTIKNPEICADILNGSPLSKQATEVIEMITKPFLETGAVRM